MKADISFTVVFRTFDSVWDCELFRNNFHKVNLKPFPVKETGDLLYNSNCTLAFCAEDFSACLDANANQAWNGSRLPILFFPGIPAVKTSLGALVLNQCGETSFHRPHRNFSPKVLPLGLIPSKVCHFSWAFQQNDSFKIVRLKDVKREDLELCPCVIPKRRCVVLTDAHVAACLKSELSRSPVFCERFVGNLNWLGGFQTCGGSKVLTPSGKHVQNQSLSVKFKIEIFAVWPWQIISCAWSMRILGLLNKHVILEEGLAWLSTLGGAHSSLGETFLHHAERAGEISVHQMRLAKELGNEIMIARCYLYWSWSLLQRGYLSKSKMCVINTWKYCQRFKCHDKVLENMCHAVWNRLQYEKRLRRHRKERKTGQNGTTPVLVSDNDRQPIL